MLRGFGIIPLFGGFIFFIGSIMQLIPMVIAVKTALGYTSVGRATGVVLIGAVPYVIIYAIVVAILTLESHRGGVAWNIRSFLCTLGTTTRVTRSMAISRDRAIRVRTHHSSSSRG